MGYGAITNVAVRIAAPSFGYLSTSDCLRMPSTPSYPLFETTQPSRFNSSTSNSCRLEKSPHSQVSRRPLQREEEGVGNRALDEANMVVPVAEPIVWGRITVFLPPLLLPCTKLTRSWYSNCINSSGRPEKLLHCLGPWGFHTGFSQASHKVSAPKRVGGFVEEDQNRELPAASAAFQKDEQDILGLIIPVNATDHFAADTIVSGDTVVKYIIHALLEEI